MKKIVYGLIALGIFISVTFAKAQTAVTTHKKRRHKVACVTLPPGSYQKTCKNCCFSSDNILKCECSIPSITMPWGEITPPSSQQTDIYLDANTLACLHGTQLLYGAHCDLTNQTGSLVVAKV